MRAWLGLIIGFALLVSPAYAYTINGNTVTYSGTYGSVSQTPYLLTSPINYPVINFTSNFATTQSLDIAFGFNTDRVTPTKAEWYNPHTENKNYTCNGYFNYTLSPNYFWCWENLTMIGGSGAFNTQGLVFSHSFNTGNLTSKTAYWTETNDWTDITNLFNSISYSFDGKDTWYVINDVTFNSGETKTIRPTINAQSYTDTKYDIMIKRHSDSWASAISSGNYVLLDPWVNVTETVSIATLSSTVSLSANQATGNKITILRNNTLWNFTVADLAGTMDNAWIFNSSYNAIHTCSKSGHIMTCNYDFILNSANTSNNVYYLMVGWNSSQNLAYLSTSTNYSGNNSKFTLGENLYCNPTCANGSAQYNNIQNMTTSYLNNTGGASATVTSVILNNTAGNNTGVYGISVNATATSDTAGLWVELYRNGTLLNNATSVAFNVSTWGAGMWNVTAQTLGNASFTASTDTHWFNISKASNPLVLANNTSLSGAYPYPISFTGAGNLTAATLYKNGTAVSNPYTVLLGAGGYNFTWNTSGNANYSANQTTSILSITQGKSLIWLCTNNGAEYCADIITSGILTTTNPTAATYPNGINLTAGISNGYNGAYNFQLRYCNGTCAYVSNATNNSLNYFNATTFSQRWEVWFNTTGNANYTSNTSGISLNISKGIPSLNIIFNTSDSVVQGTPVNITCTKPSELTVNMYNDSASVINPFYLNTSALSGTFNYTCNNTASMNYTASTTSHSLTVALTGSLVVSSVRNESNTSQTITFDIQVYNSTYSASSSGITSYNNNIVSGDVTIVISSGGYATRRYYINIPAGGFVNITGYLLSSGQNVKMTIKSQSEAFLTNSNITISRLLGSWAVISQGVTDDTGAFIFFLDPTVNYKISINATGYAERVLTLIPADTAYTFYINTGGVTLPQFWQIYKNINYVCTQNNVTPSVSCTYNDTTGQLANMSLTVTSMSLSSSYQCINKSSSTIGNLTCILPSANNVSYSWSLAGQYTKTTFLIDSGILLIYTAFSYGMAGVLMSLIITMTVGFVALQFGRPSYIIFSTLLAVVFCFMIGFINSSVAGIGVIIGLIFSGAIIMLKSDS
jgi:hypothetical protein